MKQKLVVGLGNPGQPYRNNRHNIGFQIADLLAARWRTDYILWKGKSLLASHTDCGQKILLLKPQTFMNLSGEAVGAVVRFYKIDLADMMVIHDDLDLPLGALRLRPGGGSGGHKGIKSIIAALGNEKFPRLRIGIGRPPGRMDAADYVLQDFSAADEKVMAVTRELAADAVEMWLKQGLEHAMNRFNPVPSPAGMPNEDV